MTTAMGATTIFLTTATAALETLLLRMRARLPASVVPLWDAAEDWLAAHTGLVAWIGVASVLLSVAGVVLAPVLVARLPADFFVRITQQPPPPVLARPHPARVVGRNVLGALLIVLGVLLMPLPGPGGLLVLLGLALTDFPGKRPLLAAVLRRPVVMRSINWLRQRAGREPMLPPTAREDGADLRAPLYGEAALNQKAPARGARE